VDPAINIFAISPLGQAYNENIKPYVFDILMITAFVKNQVSKSGKDFPKKQTLF
jgi:hypothetical protein